MDAVRFGSDVRLLRRRRGWTQRRLAAEGKVSRRAVAAIEAGRAGDLRLDRLTAIVTALGGYLSVRILYQGEALDRLRDRRHAALVDGMVQRLVAEGWDIATEVSFNVFGERGAIDILAFHRATATLLIVEVKTVVPDVGGLLATLDRKVRLAPQIARERGWPVRHIARILVLPEASTARRRSMTMRPHSRTRSRRGTRRSIGGCGRPPAESPGCSSCQRLVWAARDELASRFAPGHSQVTLDPRSVRVNGPG